MNTPISNLPLYRTEGGGTEYSLYGSCLCISFLMRSAVLGTVGDGSTNVNHERIRGTWQEMYVRVLVPTCRPAWSNRLLISQFHLNETRNSIMKELPSCIKGQAFVEQKSLYLLRFCILHFGACLVDFQILCVRTYDNPRFLLKLPNVACSPAKSEFCAYGTA